MPISESYRLQVRLLVRLLPLVAEERCFALKGGTAINLFIRNLPRLSVDIDLVYLPLQQRVQALADIDAAMKRIEARICRIIPDARVSPTAKEAAVLRLTVRDGNRAQVKIEVSPVLRGVVYEPELHPVCATIEDIFGFAEVPLVSFADLYAGKLMAALDRQHPRDLFDVRDLFMNEGLDDDLRQAFLVYLISHDRPMWEVLSCHHKPLAETFRNHFEGMTESLVTLTDLDETRETLFASLVKGMPERHKAFLLGFESGEPDWSLLDIPPHTPDLPAVRWRQMNLDKLDAEARHDLVSSLRKILAS